MAHWLPQAGREQLDALCERGRKSGISVITESAREVCGEVSFTSPSKSAVEKAHVFAQCQARTRKGLSSGGVSP
jgi:hypothetical protein